MDFLRIREKAKERAAAADRAATATATPTATPTNDAQRSDPFALSGAPAQPVARFDSDRFAVSAQRERDDSARSRRAATPSPPPVAPESEGSGDPLDEFFWREDEVAPGLAQVAASTGVRAPAEPGDARREWVAFLLGGEEYAVDIASVREILKAPAITEVPRAPNHVLGVIMVRGEVITVFDPRRRLGLPVAAPGRAARVLVCDAGDGARALLVDAVTGVVRLPASAVEARPTGVGATSAEYIAGIGRERGHLFILLDLAAVLHDGSPAKAEAS